VQITLRIQTTEARERKWNYLKEATGESTVSGALDAAADYYLKMRGDTTAQPNGCIPELIRRADQEGSLTASEIVDILDVDEPPLEYRSMWTVGE
jgi:hypothetical protein